jgi:hypothetical protein
MKAELDVDHATRFVDASPHQLRVIRHRIGHSTVHHLFLIWRALVARRPMMSAWRGELSRLT